MIGYPEVRRQQIKLEFSKDDAEQLRSIKVPLNNWGQTDDWTLRG
jgi:hypothetical protein